MTQLVTVDDLRRALSLSRGIVDDADLADAVGVGNDRISELLRPGVDHSAHAGDRSAALAVAVQAWQGRQTPGGQMIDAQLGQLITPNLLGPGLLARVRGLLGDCYNVRSLVG